MKRIMIIATGGTIASKNMGNGLRPDIGAETIVNMAFSAEQKECVPEEVSFEISSIMSVDSSDIRPEQWNSIGCEIDRIVRENTYNGIVILHGTDTMAYTAGALSVMFCNLPFPVVLTGSQLPIEAEGTDAKDNLRNAVKAAVECKTPGIYIAFGGRLIDGRYATKMDTDGFDAFRAVDRIHEACIGCESDHGDTTGYVFEKIVPAKVQLVKVHPGLSSDMLRAMLSADIDAALLELYGAGGFPSLMDSLLFVIKETIMRGVKIYAVSQCLYHKTDLDRYEVGRKLKDAGVISLSSFSTEYVLAYIMKNSGNVIEGEGENE